MKSCQILQKLVNLDPNLHKRVIANINGVDYDIDEMNRRVGGIYDECVVLNLKLLPSDPVNIVRENDTDSLLIDRANDGTH